MAAALSPSSFIPVTSYRSALSSLICVQNKKLCFKKRGKEISLKLHLFKRSHADIAKASFDQRRPEEIGQSVAHHFPWCWSYFLRAFSFAILQISVPWTLSTGLPISLGLRSCFAWFPPGYQWVAQVATIRSRVSWFPGYIVGASHGVSWCGHVC
jgi:hypothetical protein